LLCFCIICICSFVFFCFVGFIFGFVLFYLFLFILFIINYYNFCFICLFYLYVRSAGLTEVHLERDGAADPGRTSRYVLRRGVCSHRSRILQRSVSRRLSQQRHKKVATLKWSQRSLKVIESCTIR